MRATTLKASPASLGGMLAYYAGLADDQARRDGVGRGPVDYYLDPAEPPGRWWGHGCAALGLDGEVEAQQLEALLTARHSGTGARLGRGLGAKSARAFDATFSAPKSVSVLWALSPDPFVRAEVLAAHDVAVQAALEWFERHGAVARRGRQGVDQVDTPGRGRGAVPPAHQPQRRSAAAHPRHRGRQGPGPHRQLGVARRPTLEAPAAHHRLGLRRRPAGRADQPPRALLGRGGRWPPRHRRRAGAAAEGVLEALRAGGGPPGRAGGGLDRRPRWRRP